MERVMKDNHLMWYKRPADSWEEALPVGNGRMGAMIYGICDHEIMQLNEDSIWYGKPMDRINPDALPNLTTVRHLILENRIPEAEELLKFAFSGTPQSMTPYQPLGTFHLDMRTSGTVSAQSFKPDQYSKNGVDDAKLQMGSPVTAYYRSLSLKKAVHTLEYTKNDITYVRKTIASFPDQVIAIHMTASKEKAISFSCFLERTPFLTWSGKMDDRTVMIKGNGGEDGVCFCGAARITAKDGLVQVIGEHLVVDQASEVTIYLASETSYYHGNDYVQIALDRLDHAAQKGYEKIHKDHIRDYETLFQRMDMTIEQEDYNSESTEERMLHLPERKQDIGLMITQFHFGRYLLISSSRPGSLPANLQGIWNDKMNPKWDCKFTININTEMNYWGAECANLSECHLPLFNLLRLVHKNGQKVAKKMYDCRGFVVHHNTNGWGDCAPQDFWIPATYWVLGGVWLCLHIWKHYSYTQDKVWLSEMYDILRDAVLFISDYLIEVDGQLVTCPSCSPENTYIMQNGTQGRVTAGPTMDNSLIRELMEVFLNASAILHVEDELTENAVKIRQKLPPLQIGKHGQIMEWREDYDEIEPGHRHISQLYGLYPGHEISPDETPQLAQAAEKTIYRRLSYGGGHTGWSCAWIAGFFAALWKGNEAFQYQNQLLTNSSFLNLMTNHPLNPSGSVFQIDANLGTVSNMICMLVQAKGQHVRLLPALPDAWKSGRVRGICIPGNAELSMEWKENTLIYAEFYAKSDSCYHICWENQQFDLNLAAGEHKRISFSPEI